MSLTIQPGAVQPRIYLGERARLAAEYLNEMWDREIPISRDSDGRWTVAHALTPHEPSFARVITEVDDLELIRMAEAEIWGPAFDSWAETRVGRLLA